jgi:nitroimidazol reductase NimA-like FMN-containing flavoprotein (pyridoxamine 5'-phosphate oxidase superfamily)
MENAPYPGIEILENAECWDLLREHQVGRLAVDIAGRPDIFPINYLVHGGGILFRTAPGTKLAGAILGRHVAFEIDGYQPDERTAWSVVLKGVAHEVEDMYERFQVEDEPLFPWVAFPKPDFVKVEPELVTGRRFHVIDDIAPDESIGWQQTRAADPTGLAVEPEPGAEYHPGEPRLHAD